MTSSNATSIQLGFYQLGARLGEGGSSEVYRATGPDGREVAIKLLGPHAELDDERARSRFLREIELVGELDHPHLVKLLDSGDDPELGPYLVTELVDGPSLRELDGPLGPDVAALFCAPLAEAVAALHAAGLVHRDLKPENAIATAAGDVVLIDLGLARRPGHTRYTDEGEVVGSVPYMAPEQIEGREVDGAADVWALGVMLYELIAGIRPFARERPSEEAAAALVGAREPIARRDRRVSAALADLIERCLAADPSQRPTAGEVAAVLRAELESAGLEERVGRARHFADPDGLARSIAATRAAEIADRAERIRDTFEVFTLVDRGLAYAPEDPRLVALADSAPERGATRTGNRTWWLAGGVGLVGLIVAAIALGARSSDPEQPAVPATEPAVELQTNTADDLVAATAGDRAASQRRSDKAARRVVSDFGQLVMRSLAAERDADGNLVAREGDPGEVSNAELTLGVMGGLLDLFEEGMEGKRQAEAGETITIEALDPASLSDSDEPRRPALLEAGDEVLVHLEGKTADQIAVVTGELERQLKKTPDDPHLRLVLSMYWMAGGQIDRGEKLLAALRADKPRFVEAAVFAALVASRRGDQDEAIELLDAALSIHDRNTDALALRGRIHFRLGRTASAYRDLRAAIAADSTTADGFFGLAELYAAAGGDPKPMIEQLRALAAQPNGGAKAARRLRELCERGVKPAC